MGQVTGTPWGLVLSETTAHSFELASNGVEGHRSGPALWLAMRKHLPSSTLKQAKGNRFGRHCAA
jgi:hypothetical protein